MNEAQYTSSIHKKLPSEIYAWKVRDDFNGGVPDAFYRCKGTKTGRPLWVEYKFMKAFPKRGSTIIKPKLSAQQRHWLDMAHDANEQVAVVIGFEDSKKGLILLPHQFDGITAESAEPMLVSRDKVCEYIKLKTSI